MRSGFANSSRRGGGLEIARFGAALLVMLGHFILLEDRVVIGTPAMLLWNYTWVATDFFILISGYVMVRAYGDRPVSWPAFMGARLRRVYPTHLLLIAIFGASYAAARLLGIDLKQDPFTLKAIIGQLLLMNSWGLGLGELWNGPTWTISALLVCYAVFPALNDRVRARPVLWAAATIVLVNIASFALSTNIWHMPAPAGLARALPLFIVGMGLAHALAPKPRAEPGPVAARLGRVSFSVYMTHWLVGSVVFNALDVLLPPEWVRWAAIPIAAVGAVAAAFVWDAFVDAPIQRVLRNRASRRRGLGADANMAGQIARPAW